MPASAADDVLLATIRDFADRSGTTRVVVLLDRGPDREPPAIEAEPGEPITIEHGDENFIVPPVDLVGVMPLPLVHMPKPVPATALNVDPALDQIEAPLGVVDALARAVGELAEAMGGRSVAVAEFTTRSGEPLSVAARAGEPVVLTAGDQQFEL
ncbi:MAG: hypothetical protein WKF94_09910 [Solirubrobacteraceae bacterium]